METYKVHSGHKIPPPLTKGRPNTTKYPFRTMRVGQSFDVPVPDDKLDTYSADRFQNRIRSAAYLAKPRKFTSRIIRNGKTALVRCWRIA